MRKIKSDSDDVIDLKSLSKEELAGVLEKLLKRLGLKVVAAQNLEGPTLILRELEELKVSNKRRHNLNRAIVDHLRSSSTTRYSNGLGQRIKKP